MKPTSSSASEASGPRDRALQLLEDRWALRILLAVDDAEGARFSDLAAIPELSRRVLADRLRMLVDRGILRTERYQLRPPRHRYLPTERGEQLRLLLGSLLHVAAGGRVDPDPLARAKKPSAAAPDRIADHPTEALLGADLDAAERIHAATIEPLARYDDQYRTSLVETLATWLACDASVSVAATRLYTHRHTIRYRLDRIRELTGYDTATSAGREQLMLGLRARHVLVDAGRLEPDPQAGRWT